ncbi:hypothetical protein CH358_19485, partial [Leptospira meyeri]
QEDAPTLTPAPQAQLRGTSSPLVRYANIAGKSRHIRVAFSRITKKYTFDIYTNIVYSGKL